MSVKCFSAWVPFAVISFPFYFFFLSTKQLNTNVSFEDLLTLLQTIYADEKSQFSLAGAKPKATSIKQQQH